MSLLVIGQLVVGLVLLVVGAEALVRGASKLASAVGISSLVIGLTVVAFGTSTPELAVSVQSALNGQPDIALGNVVGSNIFNVLFILGISAIITPLIVSQQLIRLDVPIMIGVSLLTYLFAYDGHLVLWEGVILFAGIIIYTVFLIRQSRRETAEVKAEYEQEFGDEKPKTGTGILVDIGMIAVGLVMLVFGSRFLVNSAVAIAQTIGVSELVIGLTVVAAGTSLPEVATSVVAAIRGERDIAVGNVVGSNIFNILAVLGMTAIVSPTGISIAPSALSADIPFMIIVAVACLPIFFTGNLIARWEGLVFLAYYVAYTVYLILNANNSANLQTFTSFVLYFLLPITIITIIVTVGRDVRSRRAETHLAAR
ncbi:MAG: calcium/sodium antiporter [Caldilineaceae bacterium]|nr:calcium/sodium antiporter [Caldilineaceae bacterium]